MSRALKCPAAAVANQHIANRLRELRELRGVSQQKLGAEVGVSFQQMQKYERGGNRISAGALVQLARALDVPISYFYDGLDGVHQGDDTLATTDRAARKLAHQWSLIQDDGARTAIFNLCRAMAPSAVAGEPQKA